MSKYDYDFFVIGGGSGGIRAARWSRLLGAKKVALCEKDRLGGTCVIRGCVPKKLMVIGSEFKTNFELAKAYGWEAGDISLNWEKFNSGRSKEIKRLEGIYSNILKNNEVDFYKGEGKITGPNQVEVEGKSYTAKHILIAVGGKPSPLNIKGAELALSSNDMFSLKKKPNSFLVLGAGYIGLEFACIFNSLGSQTSVFFRKERILSGFDKDVAEHLQEEMKKSGINMLNKRLPVSISKKGNNLVVKDDKGEEHEAEVVLMATGRKPDIEALNLKEVGVKTEDSQILVNKKFQTSIPSIYAVGDCLKRPYDLTPVALNEGMFVSELLFGKKAKDFSYESIPSVVFTQPELGQVGLTEEEARKKYKIKVFESSFRALKYTLTEKQSKTYMKLIVCKKTDVVLGCHIVGDYAAEMLQGFAVAIRNKLKKSEWDKCFGIHPSSAEELVTMRSEREN